MSSNGNDNSNNNNNNGNNNSDFIVAAVALVVSIVALLATFMQVLQQYYASAEGYSQCNEKVMGDWAKTKTRQFQWSELRFEVQFDAPVIFVSPPTNKNGPVPDAPIFFLDGSPESLHDTRTTSDMDLRREYKMKSARERIHTADNERASWFILLFAVQRMEAKSREWQEEEYRALGPPSEHKLPQNPPSLNSHHTFTVALQRKRKSWDIMPSSVLKPYATTTMCHLIEMMAALGVYWKEFDRKRDRYWAEGNGFMVLGERLSDLGLMFSFQVSGQCTFERNRVIPVDEIKELCFGYVPTIYREKLDQRRLKPPSDEQQSLGSLQMGSTREIADTLTLIGCNNNTVRCFLDEGKRTSHLFPVTFEILGMLSRTFHIENSSFTYIPNPIPGHWDKRSVSLPKMLMVYQTKLGQEVPGVRRNSVIVRRIERHIQEILNHQDDNSSLSRLLCLRALHMAVDDTDDILTAQTKKERQFAEGVSSTDTSNDGLKASDKFASRDRQEHRRQLVQDVLRYHIQEVVWLLNHQGDRNLDSQSLHPDAVPPSPTMSRAHDALKAPSYQFDDMNAVGPDEREEIFMDVYFDVIRQPVVWTAAQMTDRRNSFVGAPSGIGIGIGRTLAGGSIRSARSRPVPSLSLPNCTAGEHGDEHDQNSEAGDAHDTGNDTDQETGHIPLADLEASHDDIWCTLVFRMICWLMLHDFNKKDIQLPKSELLGSRMPVYIA